MLTEDGLNLLIKRLEDQAVRIARHQAREASQEVTIGELQSEYRTLDADHDRLKGSHSDSMDQVRRLEVELRKQRESAPRFPLLILPRQFIYAALDNPSASVTAVKDESGGYVQAGNLPDFAALIAAPIGPRTFLTCNALNLLRLPAAPVGRLLVDDDIPF